jgi:hypothetical protein
LVERWVANVGLDPRKFATHSMRRTEATPDLPPHGELASGPAVAIESTLRYLGVEADEALEIAEKIARLRCRGRVAVLCP